MKLIKVNNHYEDSGGIKYKKITAIFKVNKDGSEERQYGSLTLNEEGVESAWLDLKDFAERNNRLLYYDPKSTDKI